MAFTIVCGCGKSYSVPDEHEGKPVQCSHCNTIFNAVRVGSGQDPIFNRNKFLLRQPALSINEQYRVWDEQGNQLLFVERPAHFLRNLGALAAGAATGMIVFAITIGIASLFSSNDLKAIFASIGSLVAFLSGAAVAILLGKKRDIYFYTDDSKLDLVLKVFQDQKFVVFRATYTVADNSGATIGQFYKNYIYNLIRKRWDGRDGSGNLVCVAREDSMLLSLLRRLLGPLFGILRTNFVIENPDGAELGTFNRKFTLLDRYVLDMEADPTHSLDRRLALALGVLLDTGERR